MKKIFVALIALALAGTSVQRAAAGNGWCTAAAVLSGVTAGVVVGSAVAASSPVYYSAPAPVYYAPPAPAYYPAPGYGYAYCAPAPQPAVVYAAPPPAVVYRPAVYVAAPVYLPVRAVGVRVSVSGHPRGHW
jgi:hypothetical protein